ncbi:UPF0182 family protein [Chamaesiphon sp. GL140_3_metabinner_50]|uniref:UPF0182 family protein n=1 Tax=Chamaesiphon sp. GL140_3_metabinner_50 TaxID=2970812 RepID=UPI0025CED1C7|nr:UPF0182 family protein [Chamaesiphon sp. GL140_3_metabinner_50]
MKSQSLKPARSRYLLIPIVLFGLWLAIEIVAYLGAEMLWFEEVGYLPMYLLRLSSQGLLGMGVFILTAAYLWGNLALARKFTSLDRIEVDRLQAPQNLAIVNSEPQRSLPALQFRWLLPLTLSLSLLIGIILIHYLQAVKSQWGLDPNLPDINPPALRLFHLDTIWKIGKQLYRHGWIAVGVGMLTIALQIYPRFLLRSIGLSLSIGIAWAISQQWMRVLPLFQATSFGHQDPVFDRDISAYIFGLPVADLLEFWLMGMCLYGFIAVLLTYLLAGDSLSQGKFWGFSHAQQRHLAVLGGGLMLMVSFSYLLSCHELLYSPRGVSFGASYTDINVLLPADGVLCILALAIAVYLFWRSVYLPARANYRLLRVATILYLTMEIGTTTILPAIVQTLIVQPNELVRETPYIKRTIALTRQAFGLDNITVNTFDPQANLTEQKIKANDRIIRNIRLWDKQPLLATNRQLQQIRLYYRFLDADIDRYTLASEPKPLPANTPLSLSLTPSPWKGEGWGGVKISAATSQSVSAKVDVTPPTPPSKGGAFPAEQQQVLIAARELDYTAVPAQAQTWVNQHLIYTHGYGFTISPVNRVATGGLPEYLVKDIGTDKEDPLKMTDPARASIPIGKPRIYYGESTNNYIMTGTKVKELDYPSGNDNAYNVYDGQGGIKIGSLGRKLLFAAYLNDWRMVLTPEFLPETKLLMRRNIDRRIRSIAPFLRYDRDPYLVAADAQGNPTDAQDPSYLYWIVDAYTTSDRYPYSDIGKEGINYIRNSVKVIIDAYHGSTSFYIADPSDPIVTTWAKIFPDLFKPLSAMPVTLRRHMRYPQDVFKIQSERLMTYHMTDPQVFYSREDRWQIPTEVYGDKPRLVEPYYLITSLPTIPVPEFTLLLPYTPQQRTNLVAWLAARSDGDNYGKLVVYTFPKQRQIFGPEQIEARINQDPTISSQISLWNRQGSRVVQGNLLIIPIDQSLLYVEPLYLEATQNELPTLIRVVVSYENRIVMAETLSQALTDIFKNPAAAPSP